MSPRISIASIALPLLLSMLVACGENAAPAGDGGADDSRAPADATPAPPDEISFQTIEKGWSSPHQQPFNEVIDNQADWQALYEKLQHAGPNAPLPAVDFGTQVVIGVGLGNRTSGGFEATVIAIGQPTGAQHLLVSYVERTPGEGCPTTAAVSQPYHLVKLAKQALPFRFKIISKPDPPCDSAPQPDACGKLVRKTLGALSKLNSCVEDSDCKTRIGQCPFGCYVSTHKSVTEQAISDATAEYRKSDCQKCAYSCAAPGETKCIGGRCEVIKPDMI